MEHAKRLATTEETERAFLSHTHSWKLNNPGFEKTEKYWRDKQTSALKEGYKNETCSCGITFLAFHHFTTCQDQNCPFSDGISLLDRLIIDEKDEEN